MEFVIQEEAKKVLEQELKKARQQRQKQVREQSVQWSEETRRKYDNEKEKQIKLMTVALTQEAEGHAKARIEHLIMTHDLAMAEVGAAHRAAAQVREMEKAKELKRLNDQQVAKQRGQMAMGRTKSETEQKSQALIGMKQRKDEIRKEADRKSKEMIMLRKPLAVSNSNSAMRLQKPKPIISVRPRYEQSAAKKLHIPSKTSTKIITSSKKVVKSKMTAVDLPSTASTGRLGKEAQLRAPVSQTQSRPPASQSQSRPPVSQSRPPVSQSQSRPPISQSKASKMELVAKKTKISTPKKMKKPKVVPAKAKSVSVTYFNSSLPNPESQYISPVGLGERETSTKSPDAWTKAEILSKKNLAEIEEKAKKQEEMLRKANSRGEKATKKAKLQKKLTAVKSELMAGHESFTKLGSGQQHALLGLEDISEPKGAGLSDAESVDDSNGLLEMSSDEDVNDLSPEDTLTKFRVNEEEPDGSRVVLVKVPSKKASKGKDETAIPTQSKAAEIAAQTIQSLDEQLAKLRLSSQQVQTNLLPPPSDATKSKKSTEESPKESLEESLIDPSITTPPKTSSPKKKEKKRKEKKDPTPSKPESATDRNSRNSEPKSATQYISPVGPVARDLTDEGPASGIQTQPPSAKSVSERKENVKVAEIESVKKASKMLPPKKKKKIRKAKSVSTLTKPAYDSSMSIISETPPMSTVQRDVKPKDTSTKPRDEAAGRKTTKDKERQQTDPKPKNELPADKKGIRKPVPGPKSKPDNISEGGKGGKDKELPVENVDADEVSDELQLLEMSSDEEVAEVSQEDSTLKSIAKDDESSRKEMISSGSTIADVRMKTAIHPESTDNEVIRESQTSQNTTEQPKKKKKKKPTKDPLKVTIAKGETTPASEASPVTSTTSAAEGPFTSTPDGQLKLKSNSSGSNRPGVKPKPSKKNMVLDHRISKFLLRKQESIDLLPVSSSSSSNLVIDSTGPSSRSPSTSELSSFMSPAPANKWSTTPSSGSSRTWQTILEERKLVDESTTEGSSTKTKSIKKKKISSGSTIAEVQVQTFNPTPTTTTDNSSALASETITSHSDNSEASGSLLTNLATVSNHQELKALQSELAELMKDGNESLSHSSPGGSDPTRETTDETLGASDEETSLDIQDMSAVVREIRNSQTRVDKSAKPYSDKELQRMHDFIGDLSDCGDIWDSPPLNGTKNHADIVASVFEELRDDFASIPMFIERPPWSAFSS